jgi:chorismate-pyruvate lyase
MIRKNSEKTSWRNPIEVTQGVRGLIREGKFELRPVHRILLTTDGSITKIIEAYTENKVEIVTEKQEIVEATPEVAKILDIMEKEDVNFRVVNLVSGNRVYAHAVSYTPLKRLESKFREDLMKADMPIGNIMVKYKIEARREINWAKVCQKKELSETLHSISDIAENEIILVRNYNIIHRGKILINITEYFPAKVFA